MKKLLIDFHKLLFFITTLFLSWNLAAENYDPDHECQHALKIFKHSCHRLHQIWYTGQNELQVPAYAWHNRYYYSNNKSYNEMPWGGGLGKSFYDEDRDWQGLYAFAFVDSNRNIEPIAGYGFEKMFYPIEKIGMGVGYTVFLTSRADIQNSIPFPGILPLVAVTYQRASLTFIYVPGRENIGNVMFVLAKWVLN